MSHWSKDAIVERAEQDALKMTTIELGMLLIDRNENLTWENISKHVKDNDWTKDDLIDQATDILVEDYMNESPY